jgi:hypothetical protein
LTKEGDRGETEEGNTAQIAESLAPGVSRLLSLAQFILYKNDLAETTLFPWGLKYKTARNGKKLALRGNYFPIGPKWKKV